MTTLAERLSHGRQREFFRVFPGLGGSRRLECGSGRAAGAARELPAESAVKPVEVVHTGDYTEGVVVDHEGNLYFSHEKIVTKVTKDGKASTWAVTGSPNGHKILADGTHLICDATPACPTASGRAGQ